MRDNHMCRRDRRQLTRKKNLVRQLPAHTHTSTCITSRTCSFAVGLSLLVHLYVPHKRQKKNRRSGTHSVSARVSDMCPCEPIALTQGSSPRGWAHPQTRPVSYFIGHAATNKHCQHSAVVLWCFVLCVLLLCVMCYVLCVMCYVLCVMCYVLCVSCFVFVCCVLCVVCCVLCVVCCVLCVVLCVVCCVLFVCCVLCVVCCVVSASSLLSLLSLLLLFMTRAFTVCMSTCCELMQPHDYLLATGGGVVVVVVVVGCWLLLLLSTGCMSTPEGHAAV